MSTNAVNPGTRHEKTTKGQKAMVASHVSAMLSAQHDEHEARNANVGNVGYSALVDSAASTASHFTPSSHSHLIKELNSYGERIDCVGNNPTFNSTMKFELPKKDAWLESMELLFTHGPVTGVTNPAFPRLFTEIFDYIQWEAGNTRAQYLEEHVYSAKKMLWGDREARARYASHENDIRLTGGGVYVPGVDPPTDRRQAATNGQAYRISLNQCFPWDECFFPTSDDIWKGRFYFEFRIKELASILNYTAITTAACTITEAKIQMNMFDDPKRLVIKEYVKHLDSGKAINYPFLCAEQAIDNRTYSAAGVTQAQYQTFQHKAPNVQAIAYCVVPNTALVSGTYGIADIAANKIPVTGTYFEYSNRRKYPTMNDEDDQLYQEYGLRREMGGLAGAEPTAWRVIPFTSTKIPDATHSVGAENLDKHDLKPTIFIRTAATAVACSIVSIAFWPNTFTIQSDRHTHLKIRAGGL